MSQFRITHTSIIYGALVHRSCSSWFPYNAKHTPLCLAAGGKSTEPKVACWSCHLPSSLTCRTSESSDTSWCVRVHGHASPPPSHICALCRNHVCPRGLKQEVKDDLEEAFRKLSKQRSRMLLRGLDRHGITAQQAFRNEGCHHIAPVNKSPVRRLRAQNSQEHASNMGPKTHPCIRPCWFYFLAGKVVYLGKTNPQH